MRNAWWRWPERRVGALVVGPLLTLGLREGAGRELHPSHDGLGCQRCHGPTRHRVRAMSYVKVLGWWEEGMARREQQLRADIEHARAALAGTGDAVPPLVAPTDPGARQPCPVGLLQPLPLRRRPGVGRGSLGDRRARALFGAALKRAKAQLRG